MTGSIMSRHPPANPYNDITGCRAVIGQRPGRTSATKHLLRELSSQPRTLTIPPSALEIIQPTEPRLFSVRAATVVPDGVLACLTVQLSKDEWASLRCPIGTLESAGRGYERLCRARLSEPSSS